MGILDILNGEIELTNCARVYKTLFEQKNFKF